MNSTEAKIEVSTPPYAVAEKSFYLLIEKGATPGSWSRGLWFPKKLVFFDEEAGTLEVPRWFLKKKRIDKIVTYV
jgi:hypothetical protein